MVSVALAASLLAVVALQPGRPGAHLRLRAAPRWQRTSSSGWATQFAGFAPAGISCVAGSSYLTSFCMVVGATSSSGTTTPVALSGTTTSGGVTGWQPDSQGIPVGSDQLDAVSCAASWACTAVGGTSSSPEILAASSPDGAWSSETAPSQVQSSLGAVSCPSSSTCLATGENASGFPVVIETTDSGLTWTTAWTGSVAATATAISCVAATTHCYAALDQAATGYIEATTNGSTWTSQANIGAVVQALSCLAGSSGDDCWASNGGTISIMLASSGTWTEYASPDGTTGLISCATITHCWTTIGNATLAGAEIYATADADYTGGPAWTPQAIYQANAQDPVYELVPAEGLGMSPISCVQPTGGAAGSCWIATPSGIFATIDGGVNWAEQTFNLWDPTSVTCPTTTTCYGIDGPQWVGGSIVIKTTDGGQTWLPVPIQGAENTATTTYSISAISCGSTLECAATVTTIVDNDLFTAVYTTIDGGATWAPVLNPSDLSIAQVWQGIAFVSCPSVTAPATTDCWVAGSMTSTSSSVSEITPGPSAPVKYSNSPGDGSQYVGIYWAIACSDMSHCWLYQDLSSTSSIYSTTDGWVDATQDTITVPQGQSIQQLTCLAGGSSDCWAVASTGGSTTATGSVLATTDGTSWSSAWASSSGEVLLGISCVDATDCVGIGIDDSSLPGPTPGFLFTEEAGQWSTSQLPSGVSGDLAGVACAGSDLNNCFAVGRSLTATSGADSLTPALVISTNGVVTVALGITGIWETYGGYNPAEPCMSCLAYKLDLSPFAFGGDPVNMATGSFTETFTPLSIPGRGIAESLSLTYDSSLAQGELAQGQSAGPLGYGWSDNWGTSLTLDGPPSIYGSDLVQVNEPSGAEAIFTYGSQSGDTVTYTPLAGRTTATLSFDTTSYTYTFSLDGGRTIYQYSMFGTLMDVEDANGNYTYVQSGVSCPSRFPGDTCTNITDPGGRTLVLAYGAAGQLVGALDPAGRTVTLSYDAAGNLQSLDDATGSTTSFSYDTSNTNLSFRHDLLTVTPPGSQGIQHPSVLSNGYDPVTGKVIAQVDYDGNVTKFSYGGDPLGPDGGVTTMVDPNGNETAISYAAGARTAVTYDAETSSPATWSYSYHDHIARSGGDCHGRSLDLPTSITDPNGDTTTMCYDSQGNLASKADALGNTSSWTYNSFGEPLSATDPMGVTTAYTYDQAGNLTSKQIEAGTDPIWTNGYGTTSGPSGNLGDRICASVPNLTGNTCQNTNNATTGNGDGITTYGYDGFGDVTSVTNYPSPSTSDQVQYSYTCAGGPPACFSGVGLVYTEISADGVASSKPSDYETTRLYDADGRVLATTQMSGSPSAPVVETTTKAYDANGNLMQATDPMGQTTTYGYDANGNKVCVTAPNTAGDTCANYDQANTNYTAAYTTTYGYDGDGNRSCWTIPNSPPPKIGGNGSSCASQGTGSPDSYLYTYDGRNNLASARDPLGNTTTYSYNPESSKTCMTVANAADDSCANPGGGQYTTRYAYDADQRLAGITYGDGTAPVTHITYDKDSRRVQFTDGTGTTTYTFNALGELRALVDGNGDATTYGYDAGLERTCISYPDSGLNATDPCTGPGARVATYAYDQTGRMTSVSTWLASDTTTFSYDASSNLTMTTYPSSTQSSVATSYDDANTANGLVITTPALGAAPNNVMDVNYALDKDELITQESDYSPPGTLIGSGSYGYSSANQETAASSDTLTYDGAGRITSWSSPPGSNTYSVNAASQLTSLAGSNTVSFSYDPQGNRTGQDSANNPPATCPSTTATCFAWSINGTMASEWDAGVPATTTYSYNADGLRMSATAGSAPTRFFTYDVSQGTPRLLSDGTNYFDYIYGPTATPIEAIAVGSQMPAYFLSDQEGSVRMSVGSSGGFDSESFYGTYGTEASYGTAPFIGYIGGYVMGTQYVDEYLINRYYDPATGQFLSVDPAVDLTQAPYAYAGDDPVNGSDPSGLCVSTPFGCIGPGPANGISGTLGSIGSDISGAAKEGAHLTIDATTDPFYLLYWGSFEGAAKLNQFGCSLGEGGCIGAHLLSLPFVPGEAAGLGVDAGGDWLKSQFLQYPAGVCDEQLSTPQWLLGSQAGPIFNDLFGWNWKVTFPGIHPNGQIDFQW